jgi:hypothetical protein
MDWRSELYKLLTYEVPGKEREEAWKKFIGIPSDKELRDGSGVNGVHVKIVL